MRPKDLICPRRTLRKISGTENALILARHGVFSAPVVSGYPSFSLPSQPAQRSMAHSTFVVSVRDPEVPRSGPSSLRHSRATTHTLTPLHRPVDSAFKPIKDLTGTHQPENTLGVGPHAVFSAQVVSQVPPSEHPPRTAQPRFPNHDKPNRQRRTRREAAPGGSQ